MIGRRSRLASPPIQKRRRQKSVLAQKYIDGDRRCDCQKQPLSAVDAAGERGRHIECEADNAPQKRVGGRKAKQAKGPNKKQKMRRIGPEQRRQNWIAGYLLHRSYRHEVEPRRRSAGKCRLGAHPGVEKVAADRKAARVQDEVWKRLRGGKLQVGYQHSKQMPPAARVNAKYAVSTLGAGARRDVAMAVQCPDSGKGSIKVCQ